MSIPVTSPLIDMAALDQEDQPILVAGIKGRPLQGDDFLELSSWLKLLAHVVPFAMLADPENIQLFRWDGQALSEPVVMLRCADVLSVYEPEFRRLRVFQNYLTALIEAWLRDVAYHWKSPGPPAAEDLAKAGLLDKLAGGTTVRDMEIIGGHLRRVS